MKKADKETWLAMAEEMSTADWEHAMWVCLFYVGGFPLPLDEEIYH